MTEILSFSSRVCHGYVGHSASVPILQHLGHDVWAIDTITLGYHPGFGTPEISPCTDALLERRVGDVLKRSRSISAIFVGYLTSPSQAECIAQAIDQCRQNMPELIVFVDPIMGDDDALYIHEDTATAMAKWIVPRADVITPNVFELGFLTGRELSSCEQMTEAAQDCSESHGQLVVATSVLSTEGVRNGILTVGKGEVFVCETTWRDRLKCKGTGDALAALLLGHMLQNPDVHTSVQQSASALDRLIGLTTSLNREDLALPQWLSGQ